MLERSRALGLLGPGPVEDHCAHAEGLVAVAEGADIDLADVTAADLGSGGGVPALVLAVALPSTRWTLVESGERRASFLSWATAELGLADRISVVCERAEVIGRAPEHRGRYELVTARSFGPPAVTAECGAPLLRVGGHLAVSEPPRTDRDRWPADALAELGLEVVVGGGRWMVARQAAGAPEWAPRRVGLPAKRPGW